MSTVHKQPAIAVDCVVFDNQGRLLLIQRKNAPFKGNYALPGGFVEYGEATETAARRELLEETGLKLGGKMYLVGVYSDPKRDPRGHTISIAYVAVATRGAAAFRPAPSRSRVTSTSLRWSTSVWCC